MKNIHVYKFIVTEKFSKVNVRSATAISNPAQVTGINSILREINIRFNNVFKTDDFVQDFFRGLSME